MTRRLAEQTATLVRQEARLAQLELQSKAKRAGVGIGMFGAAGLLATFGLAASLATAGAALALVIPIWAATLIVAALVLTPAGILAAMGRYSILRATPPTPEATVEDLRRDMETMRESVRR